MFEKREEGFERAFVHDEELRFKTLARRNGLIGLWAAEKLGLGGAEAQAYADALVDEQIVAADDEALIAKLFTALAKVAPAISEHRLRRRLDEVGAQATLQIQAGR